MREGEIQMKRSKEVGKESKLAGCTGKATLPTPGWSNPGLFFSSFLVSNRSALPGFPAAVPESRACRLESGSSRRSAAAALRGAPGSWRLGRAFCLQSCSSEPRLRMLALGVCDH